MLYIWIKETGLANLEVASVRDQSSCHKYGSVVMVDIFCANYQHPHLDQKGKLYHFPLSLTQG